MLKNERCQVLRENKLFKGQLKSEKLSLGNLGMLIMIYFKCLIWTKAALQYAQKKQMQGIEEENSIRK